MRDESFKKSGVVAEQLPGWLFIWKMYVFNKEYISVIIKQKYQRGDISLSSVAATLFCVGGLLMIIHCAAGITVFICIFNHFTSASPWPWLWTEQKILVYLLAPILGFQSLMMMRTHHLRPSQSEYAFLILVIDCMAFMGVLNLSAWYASMAFPLLCVLYVAQWVFQARLSSPQETHRQRASATRSSTSTRGKNSSSVRQNRKTPSSPEVAAIALQQTAQVDQSLPSCIVWYHGQADEKFAQLLYKHAQLAVRQGVIQLWKIGDLQPGDLWQEKRALAIQSAAVAILLISADFMNHELIVNDELPQLLRRAKQHQTLIVPIYARYCDLSGTGLEQFQPVNSMNKSLAKLGCADREEMLSKTVRTIRRHLGQYP